MTRKPQQQAERPAYEWPDVPIRVRLLRARAALRGQPLWSRFQGEQRDYEAFSIHELALAVQAELDKVGVDYQFTVEKIGSAPGQRYVEGWAIFTCVERTGDEYDISDQCKVYTVGEGFDSSDKGFGKAISYARKSGMIQGLNLAIGHDNEATNARPAEPQAAAPVNGGPSAAQEGPSSAPRTFTLIFAGKPYSLIQTQILDSVQKYLKGITDPAVIDTWLKVNADNIAALWKFSDRQGYAVKKIAEQRIQDLMTQEAAPP